MANSSQPKKLMTPLTVQMRKVIFSRLKEHSGSSMIENCRMVWELIKNIGKVWKEVVMPLMLILNYIQILSILFMVERQLTLDLNCKNIMEYQIKKVTNIIDDKSLTIFSKLIYYNEWYAFIIKGFWGFGGIRRPKPNLCNESDSSGLKINQK